MDDPVLGVLGREKVHDDTDVVGVVPASVVVAGGNAPLGHGELLAVVAGEAHPVGPPLITVAVLGPRRLAVGRPPVVPVEGDDVDDVVPGPRLRGVGEGVATALVGVPRDEQARPAPLEGDRGPAEGLDPLCDVLVARGGCQMVCVSEGSPT